MLGSCKHRWESRIGKNWPITGREKDTNSRQPEVFQGCLLAASLIAVNTDPLHIEILRSFSWVACSLFLTIIWRIHHRFSSGHTLLIFAVHEGLRDAAVKCCTCLENSLTFKQTNFKHGDWLLSYTLESKVGRFQSEYGQEQPSGSLGISIKNRYCTRFISSPWTQKCLTSFSHLGIAGFIDASSSSKLHSCCMRTSLKKARSWELSRHDGSSLADQSQTKTGHFATLKCPGSWQLGPPQSRIPLALALFETVFQRFKIRHWCWSTRIHSELKKNIRYLTLISESKNIFYLKVISFSSSI